LVYYFNPCQDLAIHTFRKINKTGTLGFIVQIDESQFQGKRMHHSRRLRLDNRENDENKDIDDVSEQRGNHVQGP